jgi:hypothetical protein
MQNAAHRLKLSVGIGILASAVREAVDAARVAGFQGIGFGKMAGWRCVDADPISIFFLVYRGGEWMEPASTGGLQVHEI